MIWLLDVLQKNHNLETLTRLFFSVTKASLFNALITLHIYIAKLPTLEK